MRVLDGVRLRNVAVLPLLSIVGVFAEPMCPPESAPQTPKAPPAQSPLAKAQAEVANTMDEHFALAKRIHSDVVAGRLDRVRKAAAELAAASPSSYPADWMSGVLALRNAAHQAEMAADVASAGKALGEIVAACGSCHAALGKGPSFAPVQEPPSDARPMQVHRWAAERMWEGAVGPSDAAWKAGTRRFPALPECTPDVGGEIVDQSAIEAAREQVAALGAKAATVTDVRARAVLFGDYAATCAACHETGC